MDFTVLAATSVLGDLIGKCPPAEACRDAFERMSKATVQMGLSTTGFGSQVNCAKEKHDEDAPVLPPQFDQQRRPKPPHARSPGIGLRPPPQFDYGLKNLFSEESQNERMFRGVSQRWQAPTQQPSLSSSQAPPQYAYTPSDASTLSTTSIPNPLPQQHQQHQQLPGQFGEPDIAPQVGSMLPPTDSTTNIPDYNNYDFDFLMHNDTTNTAAVFSGDSGLNLGLDGQRDWADGQQLPDLFGGFFFGGPAGQEGGGQGGSGGAGFGNGGDFGEWDGRDVG